MSSVLVNLEEARRAAALAKPAAAERDWRTTSFPERLLEAYRRVAFLRKGGTNDFHGYRFLQEAEVKAAVNSACRDLGIYITETDVSVLPGATTRACVVTVKVGLGDAYENGETPRVDMYGCRTATRVLLTGVGGGEDKGDKGPVKAAAAAWKYAFTMGFAIATGDDPEADASTDANAESEVAAAETPDALLDAIAVAPDLTALAMLKPRIAAFQTHSRFAELKRAGVARSKTLRSATGGQ